MVSALVNGPKCVRDFEKITTQYSTRAKIMMFMIIIKMMMVVVSKNIAIWDL